jgi:hypothetical protein
VKWKQATSYWETAWPFAGVLVLAPVPAYTPPAVPSVSLKGEPGDPAAFPGSSEVEVPARHVCDG